MKLIGDKNDPFATLHFGNDKWLGGVAPQTDTLWESGSNVIWEILDVNDPVWQIPVTKEELANIPLQVEVRDANHLSPNILIGAAEMPLTQLLSRGVNGGVVELHGTLYGASKKRKVAGKTKISVFLVPYSPHQTVNKTIPCERDSGDKDFKHATLCVKKIETRDLINVDTFLGLGNKSIEEAKRVRNKRFIDSREVVIRSKIFDRYNERLLSTVCICNISILVFVFLYQMSLFPAGYLEKYFHLGIIGLSLCLCTSLFICIFYPHRLLSCIMGWMFRTKFQLKYKDSGTYRAHFGWISYRGFLDRNEWCIHHILWYNPDNYMKTPYMMYIREVIVTFDVTTVYQMLTLRGPLKIYRIIMDSPEVYVEKEDAGEVINCYAAIGFPNKIGVVKETLESVLKQMKDSLVMKKTDKLSALTRMAEARSITYTYDIDHMIVLNSTVHLLDMINRRHMDTVKNPDVFVKQISIDRDALTASPITSGGPRQPLTDEEVVYAGADAFISTAMANDTTHFMNLISHIIFHSRSK
mmetsp:Transcript_24424/g.24683  ORF Transcript_24424/g.24683 Transcript_24424/m.24683 type:complete len:526 (+) Transcript_24424:2-1579(+)